VNGLRVTSHSEHVASCKHSVQEPCTQLGCRIRGLTRECLHKRVGTGYSYHGYVHNIEGAPIEGFVVGLCFTKKKIVNGRLGTMDMIPQPQSKHSA